VRAARVYLGGAGILAAVLAVTALVRLWLGTLAPDRDLTVVERVLLAVSLWMSRALPFVVVATVLASPFLILPFAWLVRENRATQGVNPAPLVWYGIGAVSWAAGIVVAWREWSPMVGALLLWSGSLSWALSVAVAYRVQTRLHAEGWSRVRGGALLGVGVLLGATVWGNWACIVVAGFPVLVEWRRRPTRRSS